jgi:hypothetical protein
MAARAHCRGRGIIWHIEWGRMWKLAKMAAKMYLEK